ncbi:hypothetical protein AB3N04_00120 (plasmid) [Alkalihalophilus sp. As8PL]|uniref:Uncharacterized protein n=1 Tax=Alkalihalophilus sp. As8PL TaxID=3237103 RepID=A0AB39BN48_9BACI
MKKGLLYLIVTAIMLFSFAGTGFASSSSSWSYSSSNNWLVSGGTNSEIQYSGRITPGRNLSSGNRITHRGWIENRMSGCKR